MSHQLRQTLEQARDALKDHCGGRCNAEYNPCWDYELADKLTEALDSLEAPALELTKKRLEEMAHRRCRRYIHIDTEAPYHFDGNTLTDFAGDIIAAARSQPVHELSDSEIDKILNDAKVPELPSNWVHLEYEIARAIIAAMKEPRT
jgi:hypothetical protein